MFYFSTKRPNIYWYSSLAWILPKNVCLIYIVKKKVLEQIKTMLIDVIIELGGENRWIKYKLNKR